METRAKLARLSLLAVGLFTHFTHGAIAMLPGPGRSLPLLPPREPLPDALLDRSRLRLAESAEPPLAQVWATAMRQSQAVGGNAHPASISFITLSAAALAAEGQENTHLSSTPTASPPPATGSSREEVSKALSAAPSLTPIQRLSIRNYVGESKNEVQSLNINGKEVLILRDPETHKYRGEVVIEPRPDGSVQVTKVTGATFDFGHSVEVPISTAPTEEAPKHLNVEHGDGETKLSVPAIKVEASAELGPVSESTAVFRPDGSGYEYGRRTNLAGASAGAGASVEGNAKDGFVGVQAGVGAQALKVEGFANYFSKPEADEKGQITREVYGVTGDAHVTLGELGGKVGCSESAGCGAELKAGLLGIGLGGSISRGTVKISEGQAEGVPENGIASTPEQIQQADAPELADPPSVDAAEAEVDENALPEEDENTTPADESVELETDGDADPEAEDDAPVADGDVATDEAQDVTPEDDGIAPVDDAAAAPEDEDAERDIDQDTASENEVPADDPDVAPEGGEPTPEETQDVSPEGGDTAPDEEDDVAPEDGDAAQDVTPEGGYTATVEDENIAPEDGDATPEENQDTAPEDEEVSSEADDDTGPVDEQDAAPADDENAPPADDGPDQASEPTDSSGDLSDGSTEQLDDFLDQYPDTTTDQDEPTNDNQSEPADDQPVEGDEEGPY